MKFSTQNQNIFPDDLEEKFNLLKNIGFDGFEIDGKFLRDNLHQVKEALKNTDFCISSACNGYDGWIGDTDESKRMNAISEISEILYALEEVSGTGIVIPAAWGLWSYPHFTPFPRSKEEDFEIVSDSLIKLDEVAKKTNTKVFLEPLNRYQDHMINRLVDSKRYIESNKLESTLIIADFYYMNQEEDEISKSLVDNSSLLGHIHLADNHRYLPGTGSIDFDKHINTLKKLNYDGWLAYECLLRNNDQIDNYQTSINYIKSI